jgi:hypothetical protein
VASVPVASDETSGIETLKQKLPEVGKVALARRVVACRHDRREQERRASKGAKRATHKVRGSRGARRVGGAAGSPQYSD